MDPAEIELAYHFFKQTFLHKESDDLIEMVLKLPRTQWIRLARQSLNLKTEAVSKKLGCTASRLSRYERNEQSGNILLKTLKEVAEAMDCELVYAIRPKQRVKFSRAIWPQLYPDLLDHHWLTKCDPARRAGALAFLAKEAMLSPKYRRAKGWCRKP